jgi:hypothetical protein
MKSEFNRKLSVREAFPPVPKQKAKRERVARHIWAKMSPYERRMHNAKGNFVPAQSKYELMLPLTERQKALRTKMQQRIRG